MQLGINTQGKPDVISNKGKPMRWIQKCGEDVMGDEERHSEEKLKYLQNLLNFIISFKDSNGEYHNDHHYPEHRDQRSTPAGKKDRETTIKSRKKQVQNNINLPWMVRKKSL